MMPPKLGIIAGGGDLPGEVIAECQRTRRPYFVVALKGQARDETVASSPHSWVRLGAAGKTIETFRQQNVDELVLVGSVKRPNLIQLCPDYWALKFFIRTGVAKKGDDGLLRALVGELERSEGFRVVGVHSLLPNLLAAPGVYGRVTPDNDSDRDISVAWKTALEIGKRDIGQAVVARKGSVIATETASGTQSMLSKISPAEGSRPSGVLVKISKPGQEERTDLPTIGPDTISQIKQAGLCGVAIEAGKSLILKKEETINAANQARVFIIGLSRPQGTE